MTTWVIGSGGLFGSAITRQARSVFEAAPIPWSNANETQRVLAANLARFRATRQSPWHIVWVAGRATTASQDAETQDERLNFQWFIQHLAANRPHGDGSVLLVSSAGGIYGGAPNPPFDRSTPARPISAYGRLKLGQEQAIRSLQERTPVVIARVSNLYGPGQDLGKLQGLISRLALAAITKQPLTMFVPLDTLRDYIASDDAAVRALHWAERAVLDKPRHAQVRVIASGDSVSLGRVISLMQDVTRIRIPIAYGSHASASHQAGDLRLIPDSDEVIASLPLTPLPSGMKRVYLDILSRHAAAKLLV